MLRTPFLTDLDAERLNVKGSRDPLGQMAIWTRFGRHVVGNLTTVSSALRDFTVLLLGLWFVEQALAQGSEESDLALFLKWEQLAGYARVKSGDNRSFRGVERVRKNLNEGTRITLSAERHHQILGNQKIYGLWGLYTVPARSSGLVTGSPPRLTKRASEFVERQYVAALSKAGLVDVILRLLSPPLARLDVDGKHQRVVAGIGKLLRLDAVTASEREFYDEFLVCGGPDDPTDGRQARLAQLLERTVANDEFALSPAEVAKLAAQARDKGPVEGLGFRLERIQHCESLLAPSAALFSYLLTRDKKNVSEVVSDVRAAWRGGLRHLDVARIGELKVEIRECTNDSEVTDLWMAIADVLAAGDFDAAVSNLIALNVRVMHARGSAGPWIEVRGTRLHVNFRDEQADLTPRTELNALWRSTYFVDSLRAMTGQVRRATA